ncbi:MAG: S8 family serine peptidase [Bradymonadia bacterium]
MAADEVLVTLQPDVSAADLERIADLLDLKLDRVHPRSGLVRLKLDHPGARNLRGAVDALKTHTDIVAWAGLNPIARGTSDPQGGAEAPGDQPQGDVGGESLEAVDQGAVDQAVNPEAQTESRAERKARSVTRFRSLDRRLLDSLPQRPVSVEQDQSQGDLEGLQWQMSGLTQFQHDSWPQAWAQVPYADDVVVAVLDSGVAYADGEENGVQYAKAPSLACTDFVHPFDAVNDDLFPFDDHQHGTHLTSLLAADPACGARIRGYARGVTVMPVKVLDHELAGTEDDLIEGLLHATEHGADIVNMSLSFSRGFRPSPALRRALKHAEISGVVLVSSAGNEGKDYIAWPAASPHVMSVGSYSLKKMWHPKKRVRRSRYSNHGSGLSVLAPGGLLDEDHDENGLPDGILAESFNPEDPTRFGYWMAAGTSQAAVAVTGIAALLKAKGTPPTLIRRVIELTAYRKKKNRSRDNGMIRPAMALNAMDSVDFPLEELDTKVLVEPQLMLTGKASSKKSRAVARITVRMEKDGELVRPQEVLERGTLFILGRWTGDLEGTVSCKIQIHKGQDSCLLRSQRKIEQWGGPAMAGIQIERVSLTPRTRRRQMRYWFANTGGYYSLDEETVAQLVDAGSQTDGAIFRLDPESADEGVSFRAVFGRRLQQTVYMVRNLDLNSDQAPTVIAFNQAWLDEHPELIGQLDAAQPLDDAPDEARDDVDAAPVGFDAVATPDASEAPQGAGGTGLGSSSRVFSFKPQRFYRARTVRGHRRIVQGNGLGSSTRIFRWSNALRFTNATSARWRSLGNGLGSSTRIFDNGLFRRMSSPYARISMSGLRMMGMSQHDEDHGTGMVALDE